jgi:hypothetical protein
MKSYTIYIRSNEHARNINTPAMGRTNYTAIRVQGRESLEIKVAELRNAGERVTDIRTDMGTRVWL